MAKPKKIAAKSKAKTSKYTKLMVAASKELADKKKALIKAEKALAAATKNHQEIVQEVARLDMLERSLKALAEGTEPPYNVKYIYTYPTWVWSWPNYYTYPYTIYNPPQWAFTNVPTYQGGTTQNGYNSGVYQGTLNNGPVNIGTFGETTYNTTTPVLNTITCTLGNSMVTTTGSSNNGGSCWTTDTSTDSTGTIVVDLTTHAPLEESANPRANEVVADQG